MLYSKKKFALVDCNSFYVSCERLFNPSILKKPVVVLSNNDGCVISRSTEAKNLGIKMGEPYFKVEKISLQKKICKYEIQVDKEKTRDFLQWSKEVIWYGHRQALYLYSSSLINKSKHIKSK